MANTEKYLLVPIPKNPYSRIGPKKWQDYYRQLERTVVIAHDLQSRGAKVLIAILSDFHPQGKLSELEIYRNILYKLDPKLEVSLYKETYDTLGQVEKSFELKGAMNAKLLFISAWMQYPRVRYLAHGRDAKHYGVFGFPQPAFMFIDPICILFQPLVDLLGLSKFFQKIIVYQREKGKILF